MNHRTAADVTEGYIAIGAERLRKPVQRITERILAVANATQEENKINLGWQIDHITPIRFGGSDDMSNLRPLYCQTNASLGGIIGSILGN